MYYKIIFTPNDGPVQIRKFQVLKFRATFEDLCNKVKEMWPELSNKDFVISWIDKEGDSIIVCNNEELSIAVAQSSNRGELYENQELKFYLKYDMTEQNTQISAVQTIVHSNVMCDNCNEFIKGFRYNCIQCTNYDLCMQCERLGLHGNHWMVRILQPVTEHRHLLNYINRVARKGISRHKPCMRYLTSALEEAWNPYMNLNKKETNNDNAESSKKVPEQDGTTSKENATSLEQNSTTLKHNATIQEQNGTTSEQNGTTPEQNGTTPEQNGTTPEQNGTTPEQNGTPPKDNSTTPEQADVISELKKIPINRILEFGRNYLEQLLDIDIITPHDFLADEIESRENSRRLQKDDQLTTDTTGNEVPSVSDNIVTSHKNTTSPVNTLTDEWTIIDKSDASGISSASSVSSNLNVSVENKLPTAATTSVATAPIATTVTAPTVTTATASGTTTATAPGTTTATAPGTTTATAPTATVSGATIATAPAATSVTASQENLSQNMYPELPIEQRIYHPNVKIHYAIANMISMGFSNTGGMLTHLLESVNGDINSALDILQRGST